MCASHLNAFIRTGEIAKHCIIKVNEFMINTVASGQKICVLWSAEQAGTNPGNRMDSPTDIAKVPFER